MDGRHSSDHGRARMAHGIKEVGIGKDTTEDALVISQQEEAYRRTGDDGRDELGPSGAEEVVAR